MNTTLLSKSEGLQVPYQCNKVPEITIIFWIIKMMSTTVGETGADFIIADLHFGLFNTSLVMATLLVIALYIQIKSTAYVPWQYWVSVVFVSIFGTLVTDNLTDNFDIPLAVSTGVFSLALIATFAFWYAKEKTIDIHTVITRKRELFYWTAILMTFALGTAAGDLVAEELNLGYAKSVALFGGMIAVTTFLYFVFNLNSVACFWIIYVLTRPLGASCGDLLSQSPKYGGLGFGTIIISAIFFVIITGLVTYLSLSATKSISLQSFINNFKHKI